MTREQLESAAYRKAILITEVRVKDGPASKKCYIVQEIYVNTEHTLSTSELQEADKTACAVCVKFNTQPQITCSRTNVRIGFTENMINHFEVINNCKWRGIHVPSMQMN